MSPFFKFLPLTKFPLEFLYFKSHIRQGPQHLLWTADMAFCIYSNYLRTNRSVISSPAFYVTCPFIWFVALKTLFRWNLHIKKTKLEESSERVMNLASLVHKAARKKTLWINNVSVTFLYFNIPCGFYYRRFMQAH
jgi:hypothetical protein